MDGACETVTSIVLDTEYVVITVWETDAEEDWEGQLEGVFEYRELLEIVPPEVRVEISVGEYVWREDLDTVKLSDWIGDCVWDVIPVSLDVPNGLGVIEFKEDTELLCAFEFDGLDEYVSRPVGDTDIVAKLVCIEVNDWDKDAVGVEDNWEEYVIETVGLDVACGDAVKDRSDVEDFDTEVDPVVLLDFGGVTELLGEIVSDLDVIDVRVDFTVEVPVLVTDVELDTESVEVRVGDWDNIEVALVDSQTDKEEEEVVEEVGVCETELDILWEGELVNDGLPLDVSEGCADDEAIDDAVNLVIVAEIVVV